VPLIVDIGVGNKGIRRTETKKEKPVFTNAQSVSGCQREKTTSLTRTTEFLARRFSLRIRQTLKEPKFMSETSKRELVIAFVAAVMLILFFGSGTL